MKRDAGFEQKAFEGVSKVSARAEATSQRMFGGLLPRLAPSERASGLDRASDADWALLQQEPLRARVLLRVAVVVLIGLIVWAAFAEVDEVTRGEARVIPSSQLQVVQSVDGGVVEALLVREGQIVEAGEVLIRVDPTRFMSSLLEKRAETLALQAKAARLEALTQAAIAGIRDEPLLVSLALSGGHAETRLAAAECVRSPEGLPPSPRRRRTRTAGWPGSRSSGWRR